MKTRAQAATGWRLAAAWLTLAAATPAGADWPPWLERWLFNPVERTERALDHVREGAEGDVVEPLETALRLARDHPVAQYNAGTALLASGRDGAHGLAVGTPQRRAGVAAIGVVARAQVGRKKEGRGSTKRHAAG